MEKRYKYKTLKGLINKTNQFSFSTFLNKRMYHINKGWGKFSLSPELEQEIKDLFIDFLGNMNFYSSLACGLTERLIINKHNLKASYIGGQDYPSELRYLKNLLKGGKQ